jgi:PKD repeat protein
MANWNAPCQIEFYNQTQYASEYFWDFGDGSGSTDDSPTHIYRNPGTYNV